MTSTYDIVMTGLRDTALAVVNVALLYLVVHDWSIRR